MKEGRTIYLTVTTSKVPLVKLPDLIDNSSLRQAEAKLKAMGFKLTEPEYRTLEYMGSSIEYFTLSVVDPDLHLDEWSVVQGPDKSIAFLRHLV